MWVKTGQFWFTYTLQASVVQRTAHRTQTHKGPLAVPALSIDTGVWETLVHICWDQNKQVVGLRWQPWTCAEDAATHPRRRPSLDWRCILWGTGRWSCPVCSCTDRSHTAACLSGTRRCLRSNTNTANMLKGYSFSFSKRRLKSGPPTNAAFARQVHLIAFVAGAFVRPQHVLTHAVLADFGVEGALVDICEGQEEPAKHHARREGPRVITSFHWDDFVWSLSALFNSNQTQMKSCRSLPLPSPVVPMLLGQRARNSAAGKYDKKGITAFTKLRLLKADM